MNLNIIRRALCPIFVLATYATNPPLRAAALEDLGRDKQSFTSHSSQVGVRSIDATIETDPKVTDEQSHNGNAVVLSTTARNAELLSYMMTANKPSTCDTTKPPVPATTFLATDTQAILWFSVAGIRVGDIAASEYYTPSGQLYAAASGPWDAATTAGNKCYTDVPLKISGYQPATLTGTWTVKVKLNGLALFTTAFTIAPGHVASTPQVKSYMMTRNKPSTCDINTPPVAATAFLSTDPQALLWFYVTGVQVGDVASSEYYTPSGQLFGPASGPWDAATSAGAKCFTDVPLKIAGDQAATMLGTWTVKAKMNGQLLFTSTFTISGVTTSRPVIRSGGVISASAFGGSSSIAAGTWIEIYGSNLSSKTRSWSSADFNGSNAPTALDGVSVTVNGRAAFIDYISPGQINALVPSNVGTGPMQVTVKNGAATSDAYSVVAKVMEPGLLAPPTFQINGRPYLAGLLPDGRTFTLPQGALSGTPSRPAKPGETIVLYGVGFGPVTPDTPAGVIVNRSNTLVSPLQISFGGVSAQLTYKGLAPGYTGLYQFNVVVPNVSDSDAVPVSFNLGGTTGAKALYIAVHR